MSVDKVETAVEIMRLQIIKEITLRISVGITELDAKWVTTCNKMWMAYDSNNINLR